MRTTQALAQITQGRLGEASIRLEAAVDASILTRNPVFLAWARSSAVLDDADPRRPTGALRLGELALEGAGDDPLSATAACYLAEAELAAGDPEAAARGDSRAAPAGPGLPRIERGFRARGFRAAGAGRARRSNGPTWPTDGRRPPSKRRRRAGDRGTHRRRPAGTVGLALARGRPGARAHRSAVAAIAAASAPGCRSTPPAPGCSPDRRLARSGDEADRAGRARAARDEPSPRSAPATTPMRRRATTRPRRAGPAPERAAVAHVRRAGRP